MQIISPMFAHPDDETQMELWPECWTLPSWRCRDKFGVTWCSNKSKHKETWPRTILPIIPVLYPHSTENVRLHNYHLRHQIHSSNALNLMAHSLRPLTPIWREFSLGAGTQWSTFSRYTDFLKYIEHWQTTIGWMPLCRLVVSNALLLPMLKFIVR